MEHELSISADLRSIRDACGFVRGCARQGGLSEEGAGELELAVDEICTNVVTHGYGGKGGSINISVDCGADAVRVTLSDNAEPFNPLTVSPPDIRVPLSEREVGRLGLLITRNMVDDIVYERVEGENKLTMTKLIGKRQYA
ncbi:MAG: ATP-binding protein [Candidatus Tritonobacter lacicola]|nr:ATP-binding protein [Candidatus Tritonobacter lacicola]